VDDTHSLQSVVDCHPRQDYHFPMPNIKDLTVVQLQRAIQIKEQIEKLKNQLDSIEGKRGHPLGHCVNRQNAFVPKFFLYGVSFWLQNLLYSLHSIPLFRSRDSSPLPQGSDPFSHPSGSSAVWQLFSLSKSCLFFPLSPVRPTRFSESRKRSVPGRVHSIY